MLAPEILRLADDRFHAALRRAELRHGARRHASLQGAAPVTRTIELAGKVLALRFDSEHLAGIVTAYLAHLAVPAAPAQLTLSVWVDAEFDAAASWLGDTEERGGASMRRWESGFALLRPAFGEYSVLDPVAGVGYVGVRSAAPGMWTSVTPLRTALDALLGHFGHRLVHAAAVAGPTGAVLLAGRGGSGKSTTALACLGDPRLVYLGDDLCLVSVTASPMVAWSVYETVKITHEEAHRIPGLEFHEDVGMGDYGKLAAHLYPQLGHKLARSAPVRAILLPRIGPGPLRFTRATGGEAFRALLAHTLGMVLGVWRDATESLAQLARGVPAYWLDLGDDRARIVPALADFLESLPSTGTA